MGIKGLIRDVIMITIGVMILAGVLDSTSAGISLIIIAVAFTILAWLKMLKGW